MSQHHTPRSPGELGAFPLTTLTDPLHPYWFEIGGAPIFADNGLAGFFAAVRVVVRDRDRQAVRNPTRVTAVSLDGIQINGMTVPGGGFGTILSADPGAVVDSWSWLVLPDSSGRIGVDIEFAAGSNVLLTLGHPMLLGYSNTINVS